MWQNLASSSGHTQRPLRQGNPVLPWPSPQYPHNTMSPPPPPTNTMVPTFPIYTPPHTRASSVVYLTRDDPQEQPRSFNPTRTSIQALPKSRIVIAIGRISVYSTNYLNKARSPKGYPPPRRSRRRYGYGR
ncbi:MAG: hypothetical protein ACKPKO_60375, partial [Candidatus Fonsibacter sp.]